MSASAGVVTLLRVRWGGYYTAIRRPVARIGRHLRQRGALTRRQRVGGVLCGVLAMCWPVAAKAATGSSFADAFAVKDTHGLSAGQYSLSLDKGGWTPNGTGKAISEWFVTTLWDTYVAAVAMAVWLLDTALRFVWLEVLRKPVDSAAVVIHQLIERTGVVTPMLTLAAVIALSWWWRGRYGAGVSELFMSMVMASLFAGVLSNPVATISGPNGLLTRSQNLSTELVEQVMTGGRQRLPAEGVGPVMPGVKPPTAHFAKVPPPGSKRVAADRLAVIEGRLVEIFVRNPHQIANYGEVIDGKNPRCAKVYDQALAADLDADEVRTKVGECSQKYGEAASDPANAMTAVMAMTPSGGWLVLFMLVFTLCLFGVGCLALLEALKLTWDCCRAILPGQARAAAWQSLVGLLVAMGMMVGVAVFTAIYLQMVSAMFSTNLWAPQQVFVLLDVLLVIGMVALVVWVIKSRRQAKRLGRSLAAKTSPQPITAPARRPVLAMASAAAMGAHQLKRAKNSADSLIGGRPQDPRRSATLPRQGKGNATGTGTGHAQPQRVRAAGGLAMKAVQVGLASTVGLPVAAPKAVAVARTAMSARREALNAKLHAAQTRAGERVEAVTDYGQEYVHNVVAAGRFVGKATGATWATGKLGEATAHSRTAAVLAATTATGPRQDPPAAQRSWSVGPTTSAHSEPPPSVTAWKADNPKSTPPTLSASPAAVPRVPGHNGQAQQQEYRQRLLAQLKASQRSSAGGPRLEMGPPLQVPTPVGTKTSDRRKSRAAGWRVS